ncbi:hypothetical protein psal_cds_698 [Pandoravirus salinus]|uniref:Uncharacterized protein n=1 Tax=Pandoravirus salinus TaxID=1349410 RepID=A0A291ATT2_9VIRU|nr:hypothetical protein psal_cds_698 [Pandoravirus salinus]ATE82217.1 hypothetical protein psal_cds_698 [Pandoravirus salinus]
MMETDADDGFALLPQELLAMVFDHVGAASDLAAISAACRPWRCGVAARLDGAHQAWRNRLAADARWNPLHADFIVALALAYDRPAVLEAVLDVTDLDPCKVLRVGLPVAWTKSTCAVVLCGAKKDDPWRHPLIRHDNGYAGPDAASLKTPLAIAACWGALACMDALTERGLVPEPSTVFGLINAAIGHGLGTTYLTYPIAACDPTSRCKEWANGWHGRFASSPSANTAAVVERLLDALPASATDISLSTSFFYRTPRPMCALLHALALWEGRPRDGRPPIAQVAMWVRDVVNLLVARGLASTTKHESDWQIVANHMPYFSTPCRAMLSAAQDALAGVPATATPP